MEVQCQEEEDLKDDMKVWGSGAFGLEPFETAETVTASLTSFKTTKTVENRAHSVVLHNTPNAYLKQTNTNKSGKSLPV